LVSCSRLLKGRASFTHGDYRDVLRLARTGDIVYMAPPYQGVCGRRDARYSLQTTFNGFADALPLVRSWATGRDGTKDGLLYIR
jgi:site-specific DNA-adenine methylase